MRSLATELQSTMALVDQLVREVKVGAQAQHVHGRAVELANVLGKRPDLTALPVLVMRAMSEVTDALGGIQRGREALRHYSFERLQRTHAKLNEVTNATESATIQLMDGLDRALGLIDKVGGMVPNEAGAGETIDALRNEVNELFGHLQFQDITAQQLAGVGGLLEDIEARVRSVLSLFDGTAAARTAGVVGSAEAAFNSEASFDDVESRQAAIDAAFARRRAGPNAEVVT